MAHEFAQNDGLALASKGAWHGLGTVVAGAMNPFAALKIANMEWTVEESDTITGVFNAGAEAEYRVSTDTGKVLVRSDDKSVLGIVGPDFQPFQNAQLAELAYALRASADGNTEVESAGSIRGGKRVWMLVKGESVQYGGKGDETVPYLFIANGHDGSLALRLMPTGVRVVCSNTFHLALKAARRGMSFRHTLNINNRVEELAACVKSWSNTIDSGAKIAQGMAATQLSRAQVQDLWVDVLTKLDGPIPVNPKTGWDERRKAQAVAGLAHASRVFDTEAQQFGPTLWVAANAVTHYIQHERAAHSVRTKDAAQRTYAAWDGSVADDVALALDTAAQLTR
jgi:phage/plasmid-like protein (TIGR03299 family)